MRTRWLGPMGERSGRPTRTAVLFALTALAALLVVACGTSSGTSGASSGSTYTIALSNSYIGNEWRKTMVQAWTDAAKSAQDQGLIKSYRVEITSENTATAQVAQIQSLILAHVNAIDINAASPTALNPVIQQACAAGIKVVVFDSLASAPCEYNLADPFAEWGKDQIDLVLEGMNRQGNLIVVQGVVGSAPNDTVMGVWNKVIAQNPNVHVVATVDGENASSTTEQAIERVLPSLPKVDGVVVQVGASGVIDAFKALGRPLPVVDFDTVGSSLRLLQTLRQQSGFKTSAVLTDPGQGSAALWESVDLLQGKKIDGQAIPQNLNWPLVIIHPQDLDAWVQVTPATGVATWVWTKDETEAGISANLKTQMAPTPPIPTQAP